MDLLGPAIAGFIEIIVTGKQDENGKELHWVYRVLLVLIFMLIVGSLLFSWLSSDSSSQITAPNTASFCADPLVPFPLSDLA